MVELVMELDSKLDVNIKLLESNLNKLLGVNFVDSYNKGKINFNLFKNNFNKVYNNPNAEWLILFSFSYKATLYEKLKMYGLKRVSFNNKPLIDYIMDGIEFKILNNKIGFKCINGKVKKNLSLLDAGGLKVRVGATNHILPTMNVIHNFNIEFKRSDIWQMCRVLYQQAQGSIN